MLHRTDLLEGALWSRQSLSPHQTPNFGDEFPSFLAMYLAERFSDASVEGLQMIVNEVRAKLGVKCHCGGTALSYSNREASPLIHVVEFASLILHALLRNALVGRGPLLACSQLFLRVCKEPGVQPHLAIRIDCQTGSTVHIKVGDLLSEQEVMEEYVGRPWIMRELAKEGDIARWIPSLNDSSLGLCPCLLIAVGETSMGLGLGYLT
jgi:hypothetical protein